MFSQAVSLGQGPGKTRQACQGHEEWPPRLLALVTDRAQRFQLVAGQVLGFVDEDSQPAILLLRGFRKISDQLADVGLEPPGVATPPFPGHVEAEGPRTSYVNLDAKCLESGQCLRKFVTSVWTDEFAHNRIKGAGQDVSQWASSIGFDNDRHPVEFFGHAVKFPEQDCPSFTTQAMQDD